MSQWKRVKLGAVCDLVPGFAFKSKAFGDQYQNKVIKITNISEGIFDSSLTGVDLSGINKSSLEKYKVSKGDYVIAMTGSIGKIGRIVEGEAYINQRVLTIRTRDGVNKLFLYCVVRTRKFLQHMLTHIDSHSVQANISAGSIGEYEFLLPPLPVQRRIAAVLGALDDKIENNRKTCANLEAQAQALFKSWFVDFEPFGGKMPNGWKMGKLGDVTENIRQKVGKGHRKVLSATADGKLVLSEEYFIKQVFSKDIGNYIIVDEGDFAYNPARINIGSIGINDLNIPGCVSPVYVSFRVKPVFRNFLKLFFKTRYFNREVKARANGSVRQILSFDAFAQIMLVLPDLKILLKFNQVYEGILLALNQRNLESRSLAAVRDALLPRLMSGEIDVSKVEA